MVFFVTLNSDKTKVTNITFLQKNGEKYIADTIVPIYMNYLNNDFIYVGYF